jgi:SAM-dependent methyltransferase
MVYGALNVPVLERVPARARSILDVGCGDGALGRALKRGGGRVVVGLTHSAAEADVAARSLDKVVVCDLNAFDPAPLGTFDCVVCSHILEHLTAPERLLARLRDCVAADGMLIVALPNVLHWRQRLEFLRGRFAYTDGGTMDRTHVRFYDWNGAQALVRDAGLVVVDAAADGGFPLSRAVPWGREPLDRLALGVAPGLFGVQFVLVCRVA